MNRDNSEVIRELQHLGAPVTSHSNTVEDRMAKHLRETLGVLEFEENIEIATEDKASEAKPKTDMPEPKLVKARPKPTEETRPEAPAIPRPVAAVAQPRIAPSTGPPGSARDRRPSRRVDRAARRYHQTEGSTRTARGRDCAATGTTKKPCSSWLRSGCASKIGLSPRRLRLHPGTSAPPSGRRMHGPCHRARRRHRDRDGIRDATGLGKLVHREWNAR